MNNAEALALVNEIEQAILAGDGGMKDERSIRKIQSLCRQLVSEVPEISFKNTELMTLVEIYFSPRKHLKYGGANKVRMLAMNMNFGQQVIINNHFGNR